MKGLMVMVFLLLTLQLWGQERQTVMLAEGDSVTLNANSEHAISYQWFRDGEPISGVETSSLVVWEAGSYTVIGLGRFCDSDMSDAVEVILTDQSGPKQVDMMIRNHADRQAVLIGQTISYQVTTTNKSTETATQVTVKISLPEGVKYEQITGAYLGEATYNPTLHELIWVIERMEPEQSESFTFTVVAEEEGQADQLAVVSSLEEDLNRTDNQALARVEIVALRIPNAFSPNGDGINDTFEIIGLEFLQNADVGIYNASGNEVYRNKNYQNDWDAAGLPSAVYFYILEITYQNGTTQVLRGPVTVFK